ncbi:MAG: adenosylcobinamide-GDP ribazoletransferase [Thermoplasmataceae archaeon]
MAEKNGIVEDIKSLVSYFTILPVKSDDVPTVRGLYFLSILGLFLGFIEGVIYYFLATYVSLFSAAVVYVILVTALSGFHALDSVLNTGNALMLRNDRSRLVKMMKNPAAGTGGIGSVLVVYGLTVAFVLSIPPFYALIAITLAEGAAKLTFVTTSFGKKSIGNETVSGIVENINMGGPATIYLNMIILIVLSLILGIDFLIALVLTLLVAYLVLKKTANVLSGISSDVLGFAGEIARMTYIAVFAILIAVTMHYGVLNLIVHV